MRHRAAFLAIAVAMLLTAPGIARAETTDDADDVRGRLDIASLTVNRRASGDVVFIIRFHNGFRNSLLLPGGNWAAVFVDLDGDSQVDLRAGTRAFRSELDPRRVSVTVVLRGGPGLPSTGDLTVRRPDAKTLRWVVPAALGIFPVGDFQVEAESAYFRNGGGCDPTCLDFAPELSSWMTVS